MCLTFPSVHCSMCPKQSKLLVVLVSHIFALFLPYLNGQDLINLQSHSLKDARVRYKILWYRLGLGLVLVLVRNNLSSVYEKCVSVVNYINNIDEIFNFLVNFNFIKIFLDYNVLSFQVVVWISSSIMKSIEFFFTLDYATNGNLHNRRRLSAHLYCKGCCLIVRMG